MLIFCLICFLYICIFFLEPFEGVLYFLVLFLGCNQSKLYYRDILPLHTSTQLNIYTVLLD